jgi:hypothetical protein
MAKIDQKAAVTLFKAAALQKIFGFFKRTSDCNELIRKVIDNLMPKHLHIENLRDRDSPHAAA